MIDVERYTDKYFSKTKKIVERFGDKNVTYGVFLRRPCMVALEPAYAILRDHLLEDQCEITKLHEEGTILSPEQVLFTYSGPLSLLVELETLILQKVGIACVSAHNAYVMCKELPYSAFIDMCARHVTKDVADVAAYGASVGSRIAKIHGAKGFVGSSTDATAPYYGKEKGMGTMPHVLTGYASGDTLTGVQMYVETFPDDDFIVALVDFSGKEIDDALRVNEWLMENHPDKTLGIRLDTHGGRFMQGLDYGSSVGVVANWVHANNEWHTLEKIMGEDLFNNSSDSVKDEYRRYLFGTGVSAAAIIKMRQVLDANFGNNVQIVASSGFNKKKCHIMSRVAAPIDYVGTGSFIPDTFTETYSTADVFRFDSDFRVKVGRENLFRGL